ncbi:MAG TPA: DUF2231 domain-containing protein [Methylosinus sp.]|jgi:uncharacterized membrane protein
MTPPDVEPLAESETQSVIAVAGHPIHAALVHFPIVFIVTTLACDVIFLSTGEMFWPRVAYWASALAFWSGVLASLAGTAELLLVAGIRTRAMSWTHGVAAMMLLSLAGMNFGLRLEDAVAAVYPLGLITSGIASLFTALAGYHGGKLVFHHGIGIMISTED